MSGRREAPKRSLEGEESGTRAVEAIRALIEAILFEPGGDRLKITLKTTWQLDLGRGQRHRQPRGIL